MTQQDALDWINGGWQASRFCTTINGKQGIDVDGQYGFQCKDFSNGFADFMGDPFTAGNAIALWQVPQPGWTKVTTPQVGDVFVQNYTAPDGINYGDTGVVKAVMGNVFRVVQQNLAGSLTVGSPPAERTLAISNMLGFLRNDRIGVEMTQQEAYAVVSQIYRVATDVDPEPGQADYWAKRIQENPATAAELASALGGSDYKGDAQFRYKGRHYDEDMTTKYQQGLADGGGNVKPYDGAPLFIKEEGEK